MSDCLCMIMLLMATISFRCQQSSAINVVVFVPGTTEHDRGPLNKIAQHLAFKNHGICTFKAILIPEKRYLVKPKLHLAREMTLATGLPSSLYEPLERMGNIAPWLPTYEFIDYYLPYWRAYANACEPVLNSDLMDKLKYDKYDVALIYAGNPCHLAIAHALALPFIYYDRFGLTDETIAASGLPIDASSFPSSETTFPMEMSFTEQLRNKIAFLVAQASHANNSFVTRVFSDKWRLLEEPITSLFRNDYELKKRFRYFPNVNEIKQDAALYFVNSDPLLEFPGRPLLPNVIYVGGAHMDYPKPLFEPWNNTLSTASDGVIVVSFGMIVNSSAMPRYFSKALFGAFKKFPTFHFYMRIASNFVDNVDLSEVPSNVNLTLYLPQQDLLASPHTKLLITHGGIQSILEAMSEGVPILGIPLWGPNYNNLRKVEKRGFGIILEKNAVTTNTLSDAIRQLTAPKNRYAKVAQELSRQFKDRAMTPFETTIYWIEYVGRHHGASHLRRNAIARQKQFISYLLIDVLTFLLLFPLVACFLLHKLTKMCYRAMCSRSHGANDDSFARPTANEVNGSTEITKDRDNSNNVSYGGNEKRETADDYSLLNQGADAANRNARRSIGSAVKRNVHVATCQNED